MRILYGLCYIIIILNYPCKCKTFICTLFSPAAPNKQNGDDDDDKQLVFLPRIIEKTIFLMNNTNKQLNIYFIETFNSKQRAIYPYLCVCVLVVFFLARLFANRSCPMRGRKVKKIIPPKVNKLFQVNFFSRSMDDVVLALFSLAFVSDSSPCLLLFICRIYALRFLSSFFRFLFVCVCVCSFF